LLPAPLGCDEELVTQFGLHLVAYALEDDPGPDRQIRLLLAELGRSSTRHLASRDGSCNEGSGGFSNGCQEVSRRIAPSPLSPSVRLWPLKTRFRT